MTRIVITPEDLEAVAAEIRSTAEDYVEIVRSLAGIRYNLPQMAPADLQLLSERLETTMKELIRLIYSFDQDVSALRWTVERILEDQKGSGEVAFGVALSTLQRSYALVEEVYAYARKHAMTLAEAVAAMKGGKELGVLVAALSPEGSEAKVALKKKLVGFVGLGLEFLEQYEASDWNAWEASQRTLLSSGMSAGLAAGLARICFRVVPHPLVKVPCGVIGGIGGDVAGDLINEALWGDRLSYAERQELRALQSPSGLTRAEETLRHEQFEDAFLEQRELLVEDLMRDEDLSRNEAEKIAELSFPDYYLEVSAP